MSSRDLVNSGSETPARRILKELKNARGADGSRAGIIVGVTGEAARLQLVRLAEQGVVEATSEIRGVGRPSQKWLLTELGHDMFPDGTRPVGRSVDRSHPEDSWR
jgi:predicted ArsR family transcriptional regulator